MDGFQYANNVLDFFPHSEGYVKALAAGLGGGTSYDFKYVFTYTDHLGNIRLKYAQDPSNNNQISILEEDHYYPYGLKHSGYNSFHQIFAMGDDGDGPGTGIVLTPVNPFLGDSHKYKFGGKEYQEEFDINIYDFGARNYDPALNKWMNIDPLAEMMRRHSPYNYAFNNPVFFIDPDGNAPQDVIIRYGKGQSFRYTDNNLHEAPNNKFVHEVLGANFYNMSNSGSKTKFQNAAEDGTKDYYVDESSYSAAGVDSKNNYRVKWASDVGLETENGDILSPSTLLEHEFDHIVSRATDGEAHKSRADDTSDPNYTNAEEKRVIQGVETKIAKANGEISQDKSQSRYSHLPNDNVKTVKVYDPQSTTKVE